MKGCSREFLRISRIKTTHQRRRQVYPIHKLDLPKPKGHTNSLSSVTVMIKTERVYFRRWSGFEQKGEEFMIRRHIPVKSQTQVITNLHPSHMSRFSIHLHKLALSSERAAIGHHSSWKAGLFHKVCRVMQISRFPACTTPVSYGQQDKHSLQNITWTNTLRLPLYSSCRRPKRKAILYIYMMLSFISKC